MYGPGVFRRRPDFRARASRAAILAIGAAVAIPPVVVTTFAGLDGVSLSPVVEISRRVAALSYAVETTVHAFDEHALPDLATDDVLSFGKIFRELSDESGELRDSTVEVTLQEVEPDRLWRTRNAVDVFKGQPITIRTLDNARRQLGVTPKTIARQTMLPPTFNADGSVTFSGHDRIKALLGGDAEALLVPQLRITHTHYPRLALADEYLNKGMPEVYGPHTDVSLGTGPIPLLPLDYPYIIDGLKYGLCLAMVGACQSMPQLWRNSEVVGAGNTIYLWPGSTSWNAKTDLKVAGNNVTYYTLASGLRITPVFVFGGTWDKVKSGQYRLSCVLHGVEDSATGNGGGAVITSGPRQLLHWLKNRVFGSQLTTPLAMPTDADGVPYVDEPSFLAAETIQIVRLVGGYPLRWRVGPERVEPDVQLAKIVRSMGARIGQNWEGSLLLTMFNRAQASSLSIGVQGTPVILLAGSLDPQVDDAKHANQINYEYGELYAQSGMERSGAAIWDKASVAKYGRVYDSEVLSLPAAGTAVAFDVVYHELKARTEPPHRYKVSASFGALDAEQGQTVRITHPFGLQSAAGVADAPCWIEGIGHEILSGDVPLVLLDQERVAASLTLTYSVVGITSVLHVATVHHTAHDFTSGRTVTFSGANEADYNGSKIITVVDADHYTFVLVDEAPDTATGTILAGTWDEGRVLAQKEPVMVTDHVTKTGPVIGDHQEYYFGGSLELGEKINAYKRLKEYKPVRWDSAAVGNRSVIVRYWAKTDAVGTSVRVRIVDDNDNVIEEGNTHTDTTVADGGYEMVLTGQLSSGVHTYYAEYKGSNLTNNVYAKAAGEIR